MAENPDGARIRLQQPEHQLQDRRLAGAAGAQEDLGVPGLQREADILENDFVVKREVHAIEHDNRPAVTERLVE